jgi:hypothetical protein
MRKPLWFKCWQRDLLFALAQHSRDAQLVYCLTLLLIYDHDGAIRRDDEAMAKRADMPAESVARAYGELAAAGRLTIKRGVISNARANEEMAERKRKSEIGYAASQARWSRSAPKMDLRDADALQLHSEGNGTQTQTQTQTQKERAAGKSNGSGRVQHAGQFFTQHVNLTDEWRLAAKQCGIVSALEQDRQWDAFRNYHEAKDSGYVRWLAAWRTWCGNHVRWHSGGKRLRPPAI